VQHPPAAGMDVVLEEQLFVCLLSANDWTDSLPSMFSCGYCMEELATLLQELLIAAPVGCAWRGYGTVRLDAGVLAVTGLFPGHPQVHSLMLNTAQSHTAAGCLDCRFGAVAAVRRPHQWLHECAVKLSNVASCNAGLLSGCRVQLHRILWPVLVPALQGKGGEARAGRHSQAHAASGRKPLKTWLCHAHAIVWCHHQLQPRVMGQQQRQGAGCHRGAKGPAWPVGIHSSREPRLGKHAPLKPRVKAETPKTPATGMASLRGGPTWGCNKHQALSVGVRPASIGVKAQHLISPVQRTAAAAASPDATPPGIARLPPGTAESSGI
jgi:hypothetical protein